MRAFREAVEAGDIEAAVALLADDVAFHSPVAFKPYHGREAVGVLLRAVFQVFEDFRYTREIGAADADERVLVFEARIGEHQVEGCDILRTGADGRIDDFTVMVRPLSAAQALGKAMAARLTG